jgi:adenine deaminase
MNTELEQLRGTLEAAAGLREADLRLENIQLVNVYSGEIYPASVTIYDGIITGINAPSEYPVKEVIDGEGQYAVPGFIDTHVHIETTLLTPEALGALIVPWGTTSLFVDAMEIANVAGIEGLKALIKDSEQLPFRLFLEIPSRVPTAPGLETTGGVLGAAEVTGLLDLKQSLSLGELDPSKIWASLGDASPGDAERGTAGRDEYLLKILAALERGKICNGHAIGLDPLALNVYAAAHLADDHESVRGEELLDRLRLGIAALIREGSSERNTEELIRAVLEKKLPTGDIMFCTDDKHANDIAAEGHISFNIQKAIDLGLDPVKAIQIATINGAKHFHMDHLIGSISPGRAADMVLLRDLKKIKPALVFKAGKIAARDGRAENAGQKTYPENLFHTIKVSPELSPAKFIIKVPEEKCSADSKVECRVISLIPDQIINKEIHQWMDVKDGQVRPDLSRDILKLAVIERYGKNGRVSTTLVKGFCLEGGALASSVSHDHHNIVVVGTNDEDMYAAVMELAVLQGGFAAARDGEILDSLALPLAGLMSILPACEVMDRMNHLNAAARGMGCPLPAPFMTLSFISLPTVPELGLTDYGLIDVMGHRVTELFV